MPSIPLLSASDRHAAIIEALERAGCVVVTGVNDAPAREALARELKPYIDSADANASLNAKYAADGGPADFYPGHTKRVTALIAKSPAFRDLMTHPLTIAACDAILKPNCASYHVHATAALVVGPGATVQVLHREDDSFPFFTLPRPNLVIASMWAVTDFTIANGATRLVPGSHRWPPDRRPREDETVGAEMPAGSVLLWMGGTLHGAGENRSDRWRFGVFLSYSLGWLRQEENQYLDLPLALASTLPRRVRELAGYKMHAALGYADIGQRHS